MSERKGLEPLKYGAVIDMDEVNHRLEQIKVIVDGVRAKYAVDTNNDLPAILGGEKIDPEDNELLSRCIGVLLPMSVLDVVQEEIREVKHDAEEETAFEKISQLQIEILTYVSGFENSGVELISYESPLENYDGKKESKKTKGGFLKRLLGQGK